MPLTLDRAPANVPEEVWVAGQPGAPAVGDLWLLSWDGSALGLALVSAVAPSFVLVWPVGLVGEPVFPPAVAVESSLLSVPLHLWPTRETGIGLHLLHRRFGTVLSARTMGLVGDALDVGTDPPLPFAAANVAPEDMEPISDAMVARWEAICLHTWPHRRIGSTPLDPDVLRRAGVEVGDLAAQLGIAVPEAVALVRGEAAPTGDQLALLAEETGVDPEEFLLDGLDADARLLLDPTIKDDLLRIAGIHRVDEAGARDLVRSQFALAARSDGDPQARLAAAIHRLLATEED